MSANIRKADLSDYTPDPGNANLGTERGTYLVEESLQQCGAGRSILVDANGVIIAGNKTAEGAAAAGLSEVIEVETDGTQLVVVRRTDLDLLADPRARKLATFDNRASQESLKWDPTALLADMAEGVDYSDLFFKDEIERLASENGVVIPDNLLDGYRSPAHTNYADAALQAAPQAPQGGQLVVQGEPSGSKGGTLSGPGLLRAPEGFQLEQDHAFRASIQIDGREVPAMGGSEGLSLQLITRGGTMVTLTMTARGELAIVAERDGVLSPGIKLAPEELYDPFVDDPGEAPEAPRA